MGFKPAIPFQRRQAIYRRDGHRCAYCKTHRDKLSKENCLTLDHIVPRSKRGTKHPRNLITACRLCNEERGARLLHEFISPERAKAIVEQARRPITKADGSPIHNWDAKPELVDKLKRAVPETPEACRAKIERLTDTRLELARRRDDARPSYTADLTDPEVQRAHLAYRRACDAITALDRTLAGLDALRHRLTETTTETHHEPPQQEDRSPPPPCP